MAVRGIWVPVFASMRNFGATIIQESSGAARRGSDAMTREFEAGGRRAGEAAGRATADGLRSQQAAIQRVSAQLASARQAEADATGKIRVAEAQLRDLRNNSNASTVDIARAESSLLTARQQQVQASANAARADASLNQIRQGGSGTARTVVRAEEGLAKAKIDQARTNGAVRVAEAQLNQVRSNSSATDAQVTAAEERLETARRRAQGATDRVRTSELMVRAARTDAAGAADRAAGANDRVAGSAGRAGGAADAANGGMGRLAGGLGGMAARAVGAAGALAGVAGIGGILMSGFDRLNTLQRADIMFRNVGLSADQTKQQMKDLNQIVTGTSLSMADASKTAGMLLQAGVQAGKPLNDSIKALTNIQAIAGGSADQVGMVLMQIKAAGQLMGGDAMQLQQAGVNVYGYLASSLGKSFADVKKMGEDGKITYEMVIDAINQKTGSLAKEMGETLPAKMSNMKTAFASFGAAVIGPFMGPATRAVTALTNKVKEITPHVGPAIETMFKYKDVLLGIAGAITVFVLPAMVQYAIAQARAAGASMIARLASIAGAWGKMAAGIRTATVAIWAQNAAWLANPITWIIVGLVALGVALWAFFTKTETGRKIWAKVWNGIKAATSAVVNWFKDTAWPFMQAVFKGIADVAMWLWHDVIEPVWKGISTAVRIYIAVIKGYINAWIVTFRTIATVATWLWQNVMVPVFQGIWSVIKVVTIPIQIAFALLIATIKAIGAVSTWLWQNVMIPTWNGIQTAVSFAWGLMQPVFGFFQAAIDTLGRVGLWLWQNVMIPVWNGISATASAVWNGVLMPIFDGFRAAIQTVGDVANWLWNTVMIPVWNGIKSAIEGTWKFLEPIFGKIGDGIKGIGDIAGRIGDGIKTAFSGVVDILKAPLHALGSFLGGIPGKVFGVKIPGISELHDWGRKLQALRSGGPVAGRDANGKLYGPGTGTSDSLIGVNALGVPIVRVSKDETVVNAKASADPYNAAAMAYMNRGGSVGQLNGLPALAAGGLIDPAAADATAKDLAGTPYSMVSNFSKEGIDCSGMVSAVVNAGMGLDAFGAGRMSTVNEGDWLTNRGALAGKGGANDLTLGWYDEGGGANGHTAGTLPGNIPFESHGPDGTPAIYNSGQGAFQDIFTNWMHFTGGPPKDEGTDPSPDQPAVVGGTQTPQTGSPTDYGSPSTSPSSGTSGQLPTLGQIAGQAVTEQIDDAADFFGFKDTWMYDPNKLGIKTSQTSTQTAPTTTAPSTTTTPTTPTTTTPPVAQQPAPAPQQPLSDKEIVQAQFKPYGWDTGAQWDAVDWIVGKESGWQKEAKNPSSGAYGYFQFLGATKDAYLPEDPPVPADVQGKAGAKYIKDRYTDPLGAKAFWEKNNWYDQGGIARSIGLMMKGVNDPERVLSPAQTVAFEEMVAANFSPRVSHGSDVRVATPTLDEDESGSGGKRGGSGDAPLIGSVQLQAVDVEDGLRKLNRTLRDAAKSDSLLGGWG